MLKTYLGRFLYGMCAIAALTSCGDSKAGGTAEFATVFAVANGPGTTLDSDVSTWVDAEGAAAPQCGDNSIRTTSPDEVTYTITSTAYAQPNTGQSSTITPSPLTITKITVTLTPHDTVSPALPTFQTQFPTSAAPSIVPGPNPVSVRIVDNDLKLHLLTGLGAQSITCANDATYSYRAVVSFEALEVTTNRVSTITAPGYLVVRFSDFGDV